MGVGYLSVDGVLDDDEDVYWGDMFDYLSFWEMSMYWYQQNYEWMEEILLLLYWIGQLEVFDFGFGKKGVFVLFMEGIFEVQSGDVLEQLFKKFYIGCFELGLVDKMWERVQVKIVEVQVEI